MPIPCIHPWQGTYFPWLKLGHGIPSTTSKPTRPGRVVGSTLPFSPCNMENRQTSSRSFGEDRPTGRASRCSDAVGGRGLLSSCCCIHRALRILGTGPPSPQLSHHTWAICRSGRPPTSFIPALIHPNPAGHLSHPYLKTVRFPSRWPVWVTPARSQPLAFVLPVARESPCVHIIWLFWFY